MSLVSIYLPDNSIKEFDHCPTGKELAESIGAGLAKSVVGMKISGGDLVDFRLPISDKSKVELVTTRNPEALEVIRHTGAHILAQAVQELWPDVKVTIGPVIEKGFYYDFDSPRSFTEEDLQKIEDRMKEIVKRDLPVVREEWPAEKAIRVFEDMGETYKAEIIRDLGEPIVSIYKQGEWFDLCRGPHAPSTGWVKAIKVLHQSGAYWRGDETKPQLKRIYATAFLKEEDLKKHLEALEEAKKRDHRKLGKEMELFSFHPWAPASPFFTSKGTIVYNELQAYLRELYQAHNYQEVITPQVFDLELFKRSGHYENYRENMYFLKSEDREFGLKPMNCPGHCVFFGQSHHSYRDLPVRMADFGRLHRFEKSGVVAGLTRVRTFCQDDGHIFCRMDQLQDEIIGFLKLLNEVYTVLGMPKYEIFFSTRPEKRAGRDEVWDEAEKALEQALIASKIPYKLNLGDGAFYGPKLDIQFYDALDRSWQLGTIQCDFVLPEAFELSYVGEDNQSHRPVILHRAIFGSFERFLGVYIEHTAGHFPLWMAPEQVRILNVTDKHLEFCSQVESALKAQGLRVHLDKRNEKLGFKIREAQISHIPYMLIVGDKELEGGQLTVRYRDGRQESGLSVEAFVQALKEEKSQRLFHSEIFALK